MFNNGKFYGSFYGQTISNYGRENGFVDYRALASSFNHVMCNSLFNYKECFDDWEQIHGFVDNSEKIEELDNSIEEIESHMEDANNVLDNINDVIENLDSIENAVFNFTESLQYLDFECTDSEDETMDFDADDAITEAEAIDFWSIRESLEAYDGRVAEELEKLEQRKEELEAQKEELEEEENEAFNGEIFQWYIIDDCGKQILVENTNEIIFYNEELDIYLWGVTHFGTSWDYVLTNIPCETFEEEEQRKKELHPLDYDSLFDAYLTKEQSINKSTDALEMLCRIEKNHSIETLEDAEKLLLENIEKLKEE